MCAINSVSPTVSFNSIDVIFSWLRYRFDSICFVFTRNSLFESEQNVQLSIFDFLFTFQLATGENGRITVTISDSVVSCKLHSIHRPSIWKAFTHFHDEMSLKVGKPWKWVVWELCELSKKSPVVHYHQLVQLQFIRAKSWPFCRTSRRRWDWRIGLSRGSCVTEPVLREARKCRKW